MISGMPKKPGLENAPAKAAIASDLKTRRDTRMEMSSSAAAPAALYSIPAICSGVRSIKKPLMITEGSAR